MNEDIDFLRYPIGKFKVPDTIPDNQIKIWINALENFPSKLRGVLITLSEGQLDTLPTRWLDNPTSGSSFA